MALEDLEPAVRVEEILDGADIEPATRLEHFMKKAANQVPKPAGSSDAGKVVTVNEDGDGFELAEVDPGLPEYTYADKGKVLTIGEDSEHSVTDVVVPQQTVTENYGSLTTTLSYTDVVEMCNNSTPCVLTLDGNIYNKNFGWYYFGGDEDTPCIKVDLGPNSYVAVVFVNDNMGALRYTDGGSHTVSVFLSTPTVAPVWEANKVVLTSSNATLSHLQTKIGAAFTSFFTSATNVKYYDLSSNVLTDDDLANITTVYSKLSAGDTNVVLSSLGALFPIAGSTSDSVMFVLPYYGQSYSGIFVCARITIALLSTKDVVVIAEKLYDSRE